MCLQVCISLVYMITHMNRAWLVLSLFTLAFDSSPIKGEGILLVVLDFSPATPCHSECSEESKISDPHNPTLWIPAYAGMTGRGRHTGFKAVSTGWGDNKTTSTALNRHSRVGGNPQGGE